MPLSFPANPTVGQQYLNWTWNGQAWVVTTAVAAPFSKNYIDNSGFTVNQRGYTSGTALAASAYGIDRWKAGSGGCTLNFTASPPSTQVTIAAGSITQIVEGVALLTAAYILSWQGTAVCSVNGAATVPSPVVVNATAGANLTLTWQGGTLGQVQLELGTVVTPWLPQPPQIELARCQRFFYVAGFFFAAYAVVANQAIWWMVFPPTAMRAVPTVGRVTAATIANISGYNFSTNASQPPGTMWVAGNATAAGAISTTADQVLVSAEL